MLSINTLPGSITMKAMIFASVLALTTVLPGCWTTHQPYDPARGSNCDVTSYGVGPVSNTNANCVASAGMPQSPSVGGATADPTDGRINNNASKEWWVIW